MASLTGQTIASSYEQLLHTDTDGGGNGNSLLSIKDGDNGTTFALKLATNKVEVIPGSDDANAFEVSKADGTPVLTVDSTNARVGIGTASPGFHLDIQKSLSETYSASARPTALTRIYNLNTANGNHATLEFGTEPTSGNGGVAYIGSTVTGSNLADLFFGTRTGASTFATHMTIDSSGNVGIGVSPSNALDVQTSAGKFSVEALGGGSVRLASNGSMGMNVPAGYNYEIDVNGSEVMRIDSSGNVGIGTTNTNGLATAILGDSGYPATSGLTQTGVLRLTGGTGLYNVLDMGVNETTDTAWIQATRANSLATYDKLVINPYGGNVGIGTTSPDHKLHIEGDLCVDGFGTASNYISMREAFAPDASGGLGFKAYDHSGSNRDGLAMYGHDGLSFWTAQTERMRILSGGQVMINETLNAEMSIGLTINQGANDNEILSLKSSDVAHGMTTLTETDTYLSIRKGSASNGGVNMQCFADGTSGAALHLQGAISTSADTAKSTSAGGCLNFYGATKTGTNRTVLGTNENIVVIKNDSATRFIFDAEGSGHADVEWTTYSDSRLKLNQEQIPYGLNEINQLQPKIYDRYSGDVQNGEVTLEETSRRQIGFIAQEVKEIIPELVKDVDESHSFYSMDDGKIVAVLVKAVQELSAKVEALENA